MALGWYVIRTVPRAEYLAAAQLTQDGYETFFPRLQWKQPRLGHTDSPIFPGYLLIRCDPDENGWPIFRVSHRIAGWVTFGGEIPRMPDQTVAELARRVEAINGGEGLWKRFAPGTQVRVVSEILDGVAEVIEEAKSPLDNARVLLHFMGRLVPTDVPWQYLEALESVPSVNPSHPRRTRGKGRWIQGFGQRAAANV